MRKLVIAALALAGGMMMGAGVSFAQCHMGVQAGGSIANTSLALGGTPLAVDGLGAQSSRPDMGIHGGCDLRIAGSPFFVGAFGEWNNQDVAFEVQPSLFKGFIGNSYAFGARAGVELAGGAKPYLLVAWTQADANWSSMVPLGGVGLPSHFKGWMYGGGIEVPLKGTNFSLAGEGRFIRYQSENVAGVIDMQPDQLQAMVRLNWNFGAAAALPAPLK